MPMTTCTGPSQTDASHRYSQDVSEANKRVLELSQVRITSEALEDIYIYSLSIKETKSENADINYSHVIPDL